jgi:hypothetical protein
MHSFPDPNIPVAGKFASNNSIQRRIITAVATDKLVINP